MVFTIKLNKNLSQRKVKVTVLDIYRYIESNPNTTVYEIYKKFKIQRSNAIKQLRKLVKQRYIEMIGDVERKATFKVIPYKNYLSEENNARYTNQR